MDLTLANFQDEKDQNDDDCNKGNNRDDKVEHGWTGVAGVGVVFSWQFVSIEDLWYLVGMLDFIWYFPNKIE